MLLHMVFSESLNDFFHFFAFKLMLFHLEIYGIQEALVTMLAQLPKQFLCDYFETL